jgi:antirestriction protein ArdC
MKNNNIYETVTYEIIKELENGVVPWRNSWKCCGFPKNGKTNKSYRGVNAFLLFTANFASSYWFTYKQLKSLDARVKEGERGRKVIFWNFVEEEKENGDKVTKPYIKLYSVFNSMQCEGLNLSEFEDKKFNPIDECEKLISNYKQRENITIINRDGTPYYELMKDYINIPPINLFDRVEDYYHALFHEMIHSTGSKNRLNRSLISYEKGGKSEEYSKEELIAEIGSSFLASMTGIGQSTVKQSASYIAGWLKVLKNDSKIIFQSASKAQEAIDYILGESKAYEKEIPLSDESTLNA